MSRTTISAERLVTPDEMLEGAELVIEGGRIIDIACSNSRPDHHTIAPGFLDLQVNGIDDVDVADLSPNGWQKLNQSLLAQGVTGWCPTLVTTTPEHYAHRLDVLSRLAVPSTSGPEVLGVHLEGPYLGSNHGAHSGVPEGPIDLDWVDSLPDLVRIMTLGPERPDSSKAIELLVSKGIVVGLGHTDADYDETSAAVDAGARLFTHCFNATRPLHHRDPGPVGAALVDDRLVVSIIADNVHLHPAVCRMVFNCKPTDGVVLVTDATGWRSGRLGDRSVALVDGAPRLADGTLAGSCLTMNRAVANAVAAGVAPERAFRASSTTPARLLGRDDVGRVAVGARANLVALEADYEVSVVWVDGQRQPAG